MIPLMNQLRELQLVAAIPLLVVPSISRSVNETEYDDIDDEYETPATDYVSMAGTPVTQVLADMLPIERQVLALPSNGTSDLTLKALEIQARIKMADQQLERLRDLIADISFQYSHVIRPAPRKSMRLRGHAKVRNLNHELIYHARIYSNCRSSLIRMDCGPEVMDNYPALTKNDLRASTVILKPNTPGSFNVQLSWLWYTGRHRAMAVAAGIAPPAGLAAGDDQNVILECMFISPLPFTTIELCLVKRVHWLRARAQMQRWAEQFTLVGYEMQWTVRYFQNRCKFWAQGYLDDCVAPGGKAYCHRQFAFWSSLESMADLTFGKVNKINYKSPVCLT